VEHIYHICATIFPEPHNLPLPNFLCMLRVAVALSSCVKLCTSSLVDDAIFAHIGLYGTGEAAVECSSVTHQGQALISHSSVCSR